MKQRRFEVRLPAPTLARLEGEAKAAGVTTAAHVRRLLMQPSLFAASSPPVPPPLGPAHDSDDVERAERVLTKRRKKRR